MKTFIISCIFSLSIFTTHAQGWQWANGYGGTGSDKTKGMVVDDLNNVIITGDFTSSQITIGFSTFTNKGGMDAYVAKLNSQGQVLWAKQLGSSGDEEDQDVAVDKDGNVYLFTHFGSTFSVGSTQLKNKGDYDLALIKYTKDGVLVWAKSYGGSGQEEAYAIDIDENGNIYIAGRFLSSTLSFDMISLVRKGGGDAYVAKINSQGNAVWAKSFGNLKEDRINSLSVTSDALYFGGKMRSPSLDFDGIKIYNSHNYDNVDIIAGKFDLNGNTKWVHAYGNEGGDGVYGITTDPDGNLYIGGQFSSSSFNMGMNLISNKTGFDIFLAKFDKDGNIKWAKSYGGNGSDRAEGLCFANNHLYVTGFTGSTNMSTEKGIPVISGGKDGFLFIMSPGGALEEYKIFGGILNEFSSSIDFDKKGGVFVSGHYESSTLSFGSTDLNNNNSGTNDMFLAKYITMPLYNLGGQVFVEGFPVDHAVAYLYESSSHSLIDTYVVDTLGYYDFYKIPKDTYKVVVWLLPDAKEYGNYFPTYYGNEIVWKNASDIILNQNKYDADIQMVYKTDGVSFDKNNSAAFCYSWQGGIYIRSSEIIESVTLTDISGKMVEKVVVNKYNAILTQPYGKQGIYIITIMFKNGNKEVFKLFAQ